MTIGENTVVLPLYVYHDMFRSICDTAMRLVVVSNIFEVKEFKNVEIVYMTLSDDLEIQGQTSLKLTFNY